MAVKNDLKKLRKEQRLKQADLAIAVGMCEKSISNIELEKNPFYRLSFHASAVGHAPIS